MTFQTYQAEDYIEHRISEEQFVKSLVYGETPKSEIQRLSLLTPNSQAQFKISLLCRIEKMERSNKKRRTNIYVGIKKYENGQLSSNDYENLINNFNKYKKSICEQIELENEYNKKLSFKFSSRLKEINSLKEKVEDIKKHVLPLQKRARMNQMVRLLITEK